MFKKLSSASRLKQMSFYTQQYHPAEVFNGCKTDIGIPTAETATLNNFRKNVLPNHALQRSGSLSWHYFKICRETCELY